MREGRKCRAGHRVRMGRERRSGEGGEGQREQAAAAEAAGAGNGYVDGSDSGVDGDLGRDDAAEGSVDVGVPSEAVGSVRGALWRDAGEASNRRRFAPRRGIGVESGRLLGRRWSGKSH